MLSLRSSTGYGWEHAHPADAAATVCFNKESAVVPEQADDNSVVLLE